MDVTSIHSVAGLLSAEVGLLGRRPFRAPHHTVSAAGLVGGGDPVRPGEVSLAHHGVLLLDELVEFKGMVLEALVPALREGSVTLYRGKQRMTFPARALIVGAVNPCPCGYAGDRATCCTCPPEQVKSYRARMQGSIFEHFDMKVALPPADVAQLVKEKRGESSADVQKRVVVARELQNARAQLGGAAGSNAKLSSKDLERYATPDSAGAKILAQAMERSALSTRDYGRVLRVARTIADLDGSDAVRAPHVAEAVHAITLPNQADVST
jgi:magnesium chelatase family protein